MGCPAKLLATRIDEMPVWRLPLEARSWRPPPLTGDDVLDVLEEGVVVADDAPRALVVPRDDEVAHREVDYARCSREGRVRACHEHH